MLLLDVNIQLHDGIETDLYCNPTDKHQYLLHSSRHPNRTERSVPYSLAIRLRRNCSTDYFFETLSSEVESYLMKRGYKRRFIKEQITRAKQVPPNEPLRVVVRENRAK